MVKVKINFLLTIDSCCKKFQQHQGNKGNVCQSKNNNHLCYHVKVLFSAK